MGKQASVLRSSTIQFLIRLILLIVVIPAAIVGCRGPWFKKTDDFGALSVTEKTEPRTPRGFASSRLRPSPADYSRTAAPRPSGSRTISDASDEDAVGDDLPAENQELFRRQIEAMKSLRPGAADDLLANEDESSNFSLSDEDESAAVESESAAPVAQQPANNVPATQLPIAANAKLSEQSTKRRVADSKPTHPLPKERQPTAATQSVSASAQSKAEQPVTPLPSQSDPPHPVVQASAVAPLENVEVVPETSIPKEPAKSDWRVLASEALAALQAEADSATALSADQKLAVEAKKRMLSLVVDDLDAAMTPIESLQPHEQEFFQHEFQALHAATDPKGNPVLNRRWTLALQSHRKAQLNLAAVSNLEIQNATFCTEVDSFGILSKFPQYHFRKDQELLLYCELDNFVSTPVKDGFETQLQGSYEIVDSNGRRVADQLLPMDEHVCRNQRRDYFIAYRMYMPQDVKPGRYSLKLTIEDMKGHKFGQTNVDFQIVP